MTNTLKLVFDAFLSEMPEIPENCKNEECKELLCDYAKKVEKIIEPHILSRSLKHFTYNAEETAEYWYDDFLKKIIPVTDADFKSACGGIVFSMLCLIDGVSSENDFYEVKTTLIKTNYEELHALWCEYTNKK